MAAKKAKGITASTSIVTKNLFYFFPCITRLQLRKFVRVLNKYIMPEDGHFYI